MQTPDVKGASAPLYIESLDQEGRGIARRDGKTIFVEGALPGEVATVSVFRKKPTFEIGVAQNIVKASSARTTPRCVYFGRCGGCALQHVNAAAQVAAKQRVLEDALRHIGKVRPEEILAPIHGPAWKYRHRARFTVRYVAKKGGILVGFHEKRSSFVADMTSCEVVPARISALLPVLRKAIGQLSIRQQLPQIELSIGEGADVLVLRVLEPPSAADEAVLKSLAEQHHLYLYLQPGGPHTAKPFHPPAGADLHYVLPEFDVRIYFEPTDFTQVNHAVNQVLVRRALRLLDPKPGERVADMFCGLGNFSLPLARSGAQVVGVEGAEALVARARNNAARNGLSERTRFEAMNLFEIDAQRLAALGAFDRMLIDPPRDGAMELVKSLGAEAPDRIVYVSCSPATLARDAAVLVNEKGYALKAAGIVNMFPHTAHVESIALFQRSG
ncbi:MAG TPA: 23S rRNA (uracil(1939)-C(5))-methyltransferase RlmD [Burkholderiales bacterium]|nr:23S rRNA (uracil(1939)-C(5))-methyltransferase RlmD [Burkholderiales bacterium]